MTKQLTETLQLHLQNVPPDARETFRETMSAYATVCQYISNYVFQHLDEYTAIPGEPKKSEADKDQKPRKLNANDLHHELYRELQEHFTLKSQFLISAMRTVIARYKSVKTQIEKTTYSYQDEHELWHHSHKTLNWLQRPLQFRRPQVDLQLRLDWNFLKNGDISIATIGNRVKMTDYMMQGYEDKLDWHFGMAKLIEKKGEFYLHISISKEIEEFDPRTSDTTIVGLDRGLNFIAVEYDGQKTTFHKGRNVRHQRRKFLQRRKHLQKLGTREAKRKLKALRKKEHEWMHNLNHELTTEVVQKYGPNTLFVVEDLTNVKFAAENKGKKLKYQVNTWTFYEFEQMLTYKAEEMGSKVLVVPAAYTSQRCPICGQIRKENRNHNTHTYHCQNCDYETNDDRVGAMNIRYLGEEYVNGNDKPGFK